LGPVPIKTEKEGKESKAPILVGLRMSGALGRWSTIALRTEEEKDKTPKRRRAARKSLRRNKFLSA